MFPAADQQAPALVSQALVLHTCCTEHLAGPAHLCLVVVPPNVRPGPAPAPGVTGSPASHAAPRAVRQAAVQQSSLTAHAGVQDRTALEPRGP